ncbi:MAG: hypothetical protein RMN25_02470 [Anaerolineae bacterium]|nr:hypothetical protein [Thermoflexales bacterium]MDW8406621.1 hypothetical protein [Anaerolineae bacterium]
MNGSRESEALSLPDWAHQLGRQGYRIFVSLVENYFRDRNMAIVIDHTKGVIRTQNGPLAFNGTLGLQNIAQACRQADRDQWRDLITAHFDSIFQVSGNDSALYIDPSDFEHIKHLLRARLYPVDILNHAVDVVHRPGPEGTIEALVLDLPTTVRTVSQSETQGWSLSVSEALDFGRENLRRSSALTQGILSLDRGAHLKVFSGDHFYAATHALFLDRYLPSDLPHGALVAIPRRDVLIVHDIHNMGVMEAAIPMLELIVSIHREGPGSLSPYLYWWRNGYFTVLPYEIDEDILTLAPTDEFIDMLDELGHVANMS